MIGGLPRLAVSLLGMGLLASCAHSPPNIEGCIRLHKGAACTFTVRKTKPDRLLTESEWQAIRLGRISVSPSDWAKIRAFIEKVCARKGACKDGWKEQLTAFGKAIPQGKAQ